MRVVMVTKTFLDVERYPNVDDEWEQKDRTDHIRENWTKRYLKVDTKALFNWKTKDNVQQFGGSALVQKGSNPLESHARPTPITMNNLDWVL